MLTEARCDGSLDFSTGSPRCSGAWSSVPVDQVFDPASLDTGVVYSAFSSGFILVSVPLIVGIAASLIVRQFQQRN